MKIAVVSMVKNECDIIELFVRINAPLVDHFFIIDNGSSDHTAQILDAMRKEGLPLEIMSDPSVGHPQDRILTRLIHRVAATGEFDWIAPLDADEFIQADADSLRAALDRLPPRHCGHLSWASFVPIREACGQGGNPLWLDFRQRSVEHRINQKVVIPQSLARHGRIGLGNHTFHDRFNRGARYAPLEPRLAHVPLRSTQQLVCKMVIGSHQMSLRKNRRPQECFHWDAMTQRIRDNGYTVDFCDLQRMAFAYALELGDPVPTEVIPDTHIGAPDTAMRYPELAQISVEGRFDAYMASLCSEICRLRDGKWRLPRLTI